MQALHLSLKFRSRFTPVALAHAAAALSLIAVLASPVNTQAAQRKVAAPSVRQPADDTKHRPRRRARRETRAISAIHFERPESELELVSDLHQLMQARVRNGTWGVVVLSLSRNDTLYSVNPDEALQPASNMKLFTSALALDQFGANHQFSTDVLRDGTLGTDGVLHGNIVLRGDGDPALSKRFITGSGGAMDALAQLVANAGVKRVSGTLIADASAFDTQRIPEGWQTRYLQSGYAARISALSLNENLVIIAREAGSWKGRHGGHARSRDHASRHQHRAHRRRERRSHLRAHQLRRRHRGEGDDRRARG